MHHLGASKRQCNRPTAITTLLLAAAIASDLVLEGFGATLATDLQLSPKCTKFRSASCALTHQGETPQTLLCHPGDGAATDCKFDSFELQTCPLAEEGARYASESFLVKEQKRRSQFQ